MKNRRFDYENKFMFVYVDLRFLTNKQTYDKTSGGIVGSSGGGGRTVV